MKTTKGMLIAASAAALLASTGLIAGDSAAKTDSVHCSGINACQGHGECANTDAAMDKTHGCAGLNTCKGKGWVSVSAKECKAKGGKVQDMKMEEKPAAMPMSAASAAK